MKTIDKLAWIHIRERKVLFVRTRGRDAFYFPGGKRAEGESDLGALSRELHEELGITLKPDTAVFIGKFRAEAHGQSEPTMLESSFYYAECEGALLPQSEIEELAWFSSNDRSRLTPMGHMVLELLRRKDLID